ncbi:MAG: phosphoribosylglycinamide formyltransferase [Actinobacteria bacterium]|nr:phosphoribosylglycinamide formyltransferase [Actinomycetota bacterium]MCG2806889.1 phosphoribosylglycinamide formyltransferase [Coriobacteriia bacterium]
MSGTERMRLGVLISGSGTNLQAIIDASKDHRLEADVVVAISNQEAAYGLERARRAGVAAVWVDRTAYDTMSGYNRAILEVLQEHEVDLVIMAGYMRLLGPEVLDAYPNHVLNIHPSLLPSFAGANGIREAFEYGVRVTGVTVHLANERFDEGAIIAQRPVIVEPGDTLEMLEAKIHAVEHELYPQAIELFAQRRVATDGNHIRIDDAT